MPGTLTRLPRAGRRTIRSRRRRADRTRWALVFAALFTLAACGKEFDLSGPNYPFNPPPPTGGTGSGSGGGSGGGSGSGGNPFLDGGAGGTDGGVSQDAGLPADAGPPSCAEAERRCDHEFTYTAVGDEASVEVRGNFRPDGWDRGEAMIQDGSTWKATVPIPWNTRVLYKFRIVTTGGQERWISDPGNPTTEPDGFGGQNSVLAAFTCAFWSCAEPTGACGGDPLPPTAFDWRDAVLYFVFVDRFLDGDASNNDPLNVQGLETPANWYGGDWAGVTQRIQDGYFTDLGVNALWLTVPMENSDSAGLGDDGHLYSAYHGYWPTDLSQPEPRFGTAQELQALVTAAHAAGIKIILDYAMNHVHIDSPIYQAHQSDGWFWPLDLGGGQLCICGSAACAWEGANAKRCWFTSYLPDFNFNTAAARQASVDNALYWVTQFGVDGLRLDAVKHIELSWLTDLRARLLADVEAVRGEHIYLVGETFTGDRGLIKSFIDPCRMLDGQFDFPLRAELVSKVLLRYGNMGELRNYLDGNDAFYAPGTVNSTFVGNHDVPRSIHFAQDNPLWGDAWANGRDRAWFNRPADQVSETSAYERLSVAMAIPMTSRGVPLIYYGDEIGLAGAGDPDNRRPMQWSNYNAGQTLLLGRMQKLGAIRKAHVALRRGQRTTLSTGQDTWAYQMKDGTDVVYVLLNRGDSEQSVGGLPSASFTDEVTTETVTGPTVTVPARSFRILVP